MTREEAIYCMEAYLSDDSHKHCIKCKYYKENCCQLSKAHTMAIKALEEQKTGKWINNHTTCSCCGWYMEDDVILSPNMVFFKYCPECGAYMENGATMEDIKDADSN